MHVLRRWRRATVLGLSILLLFASGASDGANDAVPQRVVAVLYPETDAPYQQIFADLLSGIEQALAGETVRTYPLPASPDGAALRRWLNQQAPAVTITLGRVPTETYEQMVVFLFCC